MSISAVQRDANNPRQSPFNPVSPAFQDNRYSSQLQGILRRIQLQTRISHEPRGQVLVVVIAAKLSCLHTCNVVISEHFCSLGPGSLVGNRAMKIGERSELSGWWRGGESDGAWRHAFDAADPPSSN